MKINSIFLSPLVVTAAVSCDFVLLFSFLSFLTGGGGGRKTTAAINILVQMSEPY